MTLSEIEQASIHSELPIVKNIFNTDGSSLIAIGMKSGAVLDEHKAPCKAKLMVIKGEIDFNTATESRRLAVYDSYDIPLDVTHSVEAYEDALFLLMLES
ncbi:hypothetical protein LX97_00033 [Nonlabens dokdonensis]|uniref:Cupin n=2 Tax=Nonlabens dokdonensis TaxID=328515 RepID=L7W6D9_NONDD|nr:hypothetical protein DDD_0199 [Nonlabens dokdonensis DSW-6]PZX43034.1 hypothetical protein LX97_00033 [Nonlabens dokdonensis]